MYIIYINTFVNAPNLHYGKACAVGVAIEAAPHSWSRQQACTRIRHHPRTYHGGGTPAVWPGDILPSAFRDHGLNSEGVSGLHHSNGLVLCRQQWCRWRAAAVRLLAGHGSVYSRTVCVCVCVWVCVGVCGCVGVGVWVCGCVGV